MSKQKTKKRKVSFPSAYIIALIIGLIVVFITWVYPHSSDPNLQVKKLGILDAFSIPVLGFQKASLLIIFLFFIGGFLHMLICTNVLNEVIKKIAIKFQKREWIFILIFVFVFSLGGSIFSLWEDSLPFYAVLSPVLIEMGFNEYAAIFIILLSSITGNMVSTINPIAIGVAQQAANGTHLGNIVATKNGLIERFILFLMLTTITFFIVNTGCNMIKKAVAAGKEKTKKQAFRFYKKRKSDAQINQLIPIDYGDEINNILYTKKSHKKQRIKNDHEYINELNHINRYYNLRNKHLNLDTNQKLDSKQIQKQKLLNTKKLVVPEQTNTNSLLNQKLKKFSGTEKAILSIAGIVFFILFTSLIPYDQLFNVSFFQDVANWVNKYLFVFVSNQLFHPFGEWSFEEITILFFFAGIIVAIIGRIREKEFFKLFLKEGTVPLIMVAFIIAFFAGISTLLQESNLIIVLLHYIKIGVAHLPLVWFFLIIFLLFFILSIIIPSQTSFSFAIFPIFGPLIYEITHNSNLVALGIICYLLANGLANLIAPTIAVVHGVCDLQGITYVDYVKHFWKIAVLYFVLFIIAVITLTYILK